MKTPPRNYVKTILGAALLFGASALVACGDSDENDDDGDTAGDDDDGDDGSTTDDPTTGITVTTVDPDTTDTPDTSDTVDDTLDDTAGDTTDTDGDGFEFSDDPYGDYAQIDRHGAVEAGTAGIAAPEGLGFNRGSDISIRDEYNASEPSEDAAGMWLEEISASVTFFHGALDDDIMGLGLVPATVDQALAQAGPVIVPDTIKYDPSLPTAYPNGRTLEDQVVDITLAAVLLQLGPEQPLSFFADLPLNPPENDVPFQADFPYLAAPHAP